MKAHTNDFENEIKLHGRQLDSKVIYPSLSGTVELGVNELNSITPHYEGGILKSVMRGLTIDSNVEIPKGTMLNYQFGVLVNGAFEYLNFGNYIVNTVEKQEDTNSYLIECCDSMLYAMKDYESPNITYPITIRSYINAICNKIGLTFKNSNDTFANYDKEIPNELYSNIGYTFRDVLDELAQVTASTICINENDDELEIRYIGNGLKQKVEYLIKDMEEEQDVSNMIFAMDTDNYNPSQLIDGIENPGQILSFSNISESLGYMIFISNGQILLTMSSRIGVYNPDGTRFENVDNSHIYLWYVKAEIVNGIMSYARAIVLNDLTTNTQYGNLQLEEDMIITELDTTYYPNSVIWNCLKIIDIQLQQYFIDEEYLKDVNVNFGEKYGPVNSIVLTRAGGADSVYLQDQQSITQNGLCELKIEDNQIMNGNDRADYLTGILAKLKGLEYYTNDFTSTGITYLELCDRYNVVIGENTYPCIMFNDEIDITQGLEEIIHTDMPEQSETDYKYASKDDRQINQAYIIAKKNEAEIVELANKIIDVSKTIQSVGQIQLENAHEGILHRLEISGNIQATFPSNSLYPSDTTYSSVCGLWVYDIKNNEIDTENSKYYTLDFLYLNYISDDVHDVYFYEDGKQWIERNVGIDNQGNKYALQETVVEQGEDIEIRVNKESYLTMNAFGNYNNAILKCTYLLENQYTNVFANQVEVKSELNLLGDSLEAKVSQVADEDGNVTSASIILAVNNDTSETIIDADKISLQGKQINLTTENISIDSQFLDIKSSGLIEMNDVQEQSAGDSFISMYSGKGLAYEHSANYSSSGIYLNDTGIQSFGYGYTSATANLTAGKGAPPTLYMSCSGSNVSGETNGSVQIRHSLINMVNLDTYSNTLITADGIRTPFLTQISSENKKKNFEKFENGLDVIKNIDIYKYHLKNQEDVEKKHIGFIIGDNYKYSQEITNNENDGVDIYSFVSVCCKAIQEQQEQINLLKQEINLLKEGIDKQCKK